MLLQNMSVTTIRATSAINCLHVTDEAHPRAPSKDRLGVESHLQLIENFMDPKLLRFGSVLNTEFELRCPNCVLEVNRQQELDFVLQMRLGRPKSVVYVDVGPGTEIFSSLLIR